MSISVIADMVREAEKHADDLSKDRIRAIEYYQGVMKDTPSDKGRSSMVSKDVRATVKKVLPSIMRTLLGGGKLVEYQPVSEGDEEGSDQASDYVNEVVMVESDGYQAVESAVHDALLLRNGILKWWFEEKRTAKVSDHSGLPEDAFAALVGEADTEVSEHTEREEATDQGQIMVHDLRIKRIVTERNIRVSAVPRERLLIHPDAISFSDSVLTGEKTQISRSDLVAMGYDKATVWELSQGDESDDYESDIRRDTVSDSDEAHRANEMIDYYDFYVRFDSDDDGIAELRHMCFAGGLGENNLLLDEEADEVQICDLKAMSNPHQWEGISLFDDVADIQQAKTVLLRSTLDNLYWQNNPQPIMQDGAIANPDAVYNPEFGLPIRTKQGIDVRAALGFNSVPFVARDSFAMMGYFDEEIQNRTGVTDASSGLAPDALQNMTAKASAMIEQAGIGQTELMVRTLAEGLRVFFRGVLKLVVKHQDVPRTIRLRGEWVQFDPRSWNSDMDCTVNTGLGAGTRERDMQVMQSVMVIQEKLLAAFGADNPFVKPDNLYAAVEKLVEAAGLKSAQTYFTKPDPQDIAARLEAQKNQPDPAAAKAQADAQAQQAKMQADLQLEQAKLQMQGQKQQAEAQMAGVKIESDTALARERMAAEFQLKREQMAAEMELKRSQMIAEIGLRQQTQSANLGGAIRFGGEVG